MLDYSTHRLIPPVLTNKLCQPISGLVNYLYSIVLLKRIITDLPLSRFTHEVADGEVMSYLYEKYSHTSVYHRTGNFHSFFSYAVKWKYLEENP